MGVIVGFGSFEMKTVVSFSRMWEGTFCFCNSDVSLKLVVRE